MSRLTLFNSPLLLGFDRFVEALERVSKASTDGYPPYNVEQTDDGRWVRHGAKPQISTFVMLVRRKPGTDQTALFAESHRDRREILGAFIAELDFGLADDDGADPVHEIVIIGPRRDLEERWDFFLSGL